MQLMFYLLYFRMFKPLVTIIVGSLMAMSAESLRVEAPDRINHIYLDDLSTYCSYIAVNAALIQKSVRKVLKNSGVINNVI